ASPTPTSARLTLSLHDALPIYPFADDNTASFSTDPFGADDGGDPFKQAAAGERRLRDAYWYTPHRLGQLIEIEEYLKSLPETGRSEEHTSELQSRENLVCRLLL